jgi:hypothetical protein
MLFSETKFTHTTREGKKAKKKRGRRRRRAARRVEFIVNLESSRNSRNLL